MEMLINGREAGRDKTALDYFFNNRWKKDQPEETIRFHLYRMI